MEPVKGLKEFLAWIDATGLRKAAVSNAPRQNVHVMLAALGLGSYFERIILGEDTPRPKPFPDPYLAGLEFFGLQPDDVIVVEDSPAGVVLFVTLPPPIHLQTWLCPRFLARVGRMMSLFWKMPLHI